MYQEFQSVKQFAVWTDITQEKNKYKEIKKKIKISGNSFSRITNQEALKKTDPILLSLLSFKFKWKVEESYPQAQTKYYSRFKR